MLFCLALVALLLYDTVFANGVCSQTYDKAPGKIEALSLYYHHLGQKRCDYIIHAPRDFSILLNFTDIFGFSSPSPTARSLVSLEDAFQKEEEEDKDEVHDKAPNGRIPPTRRKSHDNKKVPMSLDTSVASCLPEVQIVEVRERRRVAGTADSSLLANIGGGRSATSGEEVMMDRICHLRHNYRAPQVFQSRTHELRLKFRWLPTSESVGFSVDFTFHHTPVSCEFSCADSSSCLPTWSMVCDGVTDCADLSDEHDCPPPIPFPSSHPPSLRFPDAGGNSTGSVSSVQIIIIVIAAVLTAGVFTCVVSQRYKMGARPWNERWAAVRSSPHATTTTAATSTSSTSSHRHHHHHLYHHQLHRHHPINHNPSTILYVPSGAAAAAAAEDDIRLIQQHDMALMRERQIRLHSVHTDMELDLPTSIQLPDGEETPYDAMQHVHLRNVDQESEVYRECIRPPPNRTIFEGESPPPYHKCSSSSTGSVGSAASSSSSSSTSSNSSSSSSSVSSSSAASVSSSAASSSSLTYPRTFYGPSSCNNGNESPLVTSTNSEGGESGGGGHGHGRGGLALPLPHHLRIARLVSKTASMFSAASSSFIDSAANSHVPPRPPDPAEQVLSNSDIYKEIVKVHKGSGSGV